MQDTTLHLKLLVKENQTTLPRCLQVLSRRGFVLKGLLTQSLEEGRAHLHITLDGPEHWHSAIPGLLTKNVDVLAVETVDNDD